MLLLTALAAAWMAYANYNHTWPFAAQSGPQKKKRAAEKPWQPEPWQPVTAEDGLIDRFVRLRKAGDPAALALLRPLPAEDQPIDDADFDARATDHFLRSDKLEIIDIWKGDPGSDGKPRPSPGRYILVTRGTVATPLIRVRNATGGDSPSQLNMVNPDLVVEVKDGVIRGLRAELHKVP
jgi:hypothetical protein